MTPEPSGKNSTNKKNTFVVQKHDASHLHYDFRLELHGTLKSWAVPKGPSLDPTIKRLAVQVEDHPISYGSFEGIIPAGQYGGGTVMLWDAGKWISQDSNPYAAYTKGHMTFLLKGKKLKGLWKLIRLANDKKNWLLMKVPDEYAKNSNKEEIISKKLSVKTSRNMEEIALGKKNKKKDNYLELKALPSKTMPKEIYPQLATLVRNIPSGNNWLHEIKFDGYRLICFIKNKEIKLITRGQQDWSYKFPHLIKKLRSLNVKNAILDGELVALDENQHSNFQLLQNQLSEGDDKNLCYYLFDLVYLNDKNLTLLPLLNRKKLLKKIIKNDTDTLRYSDHVISSGEKIFKEACKLGLEGIVSKDINGSYIQKRTLDWVKIKCVKRQEFIVGGFTKSKKNRSYFGSLLIGTNLKNGKLIYCGHVGTGFTETSLKKMDDLLKKYQIDEMPFNKKPPKFNTSKWVKPKLVIEVEFTNWTKDGILRHPSFKGLRLDKTVKEIIKEKPVTMKKPNKNAKLLASITHPERVIYPASDITKLDLVEYYIEIHKWILPYIINRPLSLVRCPDNYKKCFYQKHLDKFDNKNIYKISIKEKKDKRNYIYIKNLKGLITLVQMGVVEIHPWGCKIDKIEKPDMITFDLDPALNVKWSEVVSAAHYLREELKKLKLESFIKTTGGKGLHLVIPIKRLYSWEEVKIFSKTFVDFIVSKNPKKFTSNMAKNKRIGKIFLDYLRNQRGATAIAAYGVRAHEGASVAMPISWEELTSKLNPAKFNLLTTPEILKRLKNNPWKNFFRSCQKLPLR